ncbi:glycosyltransferase family 4 protein [Parvicella tangerina]|uniref:Glycosyltransferase EpsD n=1 Tax=Parvicella tangerina TaxID=2829795 RepID=A0A916NHV6_9FLAO|nr:glycosyltransferase family 4 protein [Parvicella tangerina]CAG5083871.1 Putative glycosyltransferase EpsD [Parvicella tangerina]
MKILVISDYEKFHTVRPEAEIFISLAQRGYDITIMTKGHYDYVQRFKENGIRVIDFHPEKKLDSSEVAFIRKELLEGNYDVMHMYNNVAMMNGLKAAKGIDITCVLYRGYSANVHWYDPTLYFKLLHPRADYIICNSEGVATIMREKGKVSPEKLVTINKGHKLEWYADVAEHDIRQELGLTPDAMVVVLVANNRTMKGTKYLMEATKSLDPNNNLHIVMVGKDLDNEESQAILKDSAFRDHVHFLGFRKDALNIVKSCDVFLLTSIKGESITKSVIEAMSLGVAPVISDIIGNKELVIHEESGLIVPSKDSKGFANALTRLYKDRDLLNQIKQNAPQRIATRLSHDQTVEKYEAFYQSLGK